MQVGVIVAMVLVTVVVVVVFQRSLDKPGGRDAWGGGGGDPFGPINAIFNPGQDRAQQNLQEYEKKREVAPSPEPELTPDGRLVFRRGPDGTLRPGGRPTETSAADPATPDEP